MLPLFERLVQARILLSQGPQRNVLPELVSLHLEMYLETEEVMDLLHNQQFQKARDKLDALIQEMSIPVVMADSEREQVLANARTKLSRLSDQLASLETKKEEMVFLMERFSQEYYLAVGHLVAAILDAKIELKKRAATAKHKDTNKDEEDKIVGKKTPDWLGKEEREAEATRVETDDESTNSKHSESRKDPLEDDEEFQKWKEQKEYIDAEFLRAPSEKLREMNKDDKAELKKVFREAAKVCHPDVVPDEFKKEAEEKFKEINSLYKKLDIEGIKGVLNSSRAAFQKKQDSGSSDVGILYARIARLSKTIETTEIEIARIVVNPAYVQAKQTKDWQAYFEGVRAELAKELEALRQQLSDMG